MRRQRPQTLPPNVVEIYRNADKLVTAGEIPIPTPATALVLRHLADEIEHRHIRHNTDAVFQNWYEMCRDISRYVQNRSTYVPTRSDKFPVEQYLQLARDWDFEPKYIPAQGLLAHTPDVTVRPDLPTITLDRSGELRFGRFPLLLAREGGNFKVRFQGPGSGGLPRSNGAFPYHPHGGAVGICEGGWSPYLRAASARNDLLSYMEVYYNALCMVDDMTRNDSGYTRGWFNSAGTCDICGRFMGGRDYTKDELARGVRGACSRCAGYPLCSVCAAASGVLNATLPQLKCNYCRFSGWGYKWAPSVKAVYEMPCEKCGTNPWATIPMKIGTDVTAWLCATCAKPRAADGIKFRHYFQTKVNTNGETEAGD